MSTCSHSIIDTESRPFEGAAYGAEPNPAAHGSIRRTEFCRSCGASRTTNINGPHVEVGEWNRTKQFVGLKGSGKGYHIYGDPSRAGCAIAIPVVHSSGAWRERGVPVRFEELPEGAQNMALGIRAQELGRA